MDWETPVDAWYVWAGVSLVSLAVAGVVLGLPTGPPPDAAEATNAIEETAASSHEAAATLEYDADAVRIDGKTVELRNEHGTSRSSITYGQVVAVNGDERLERLVYGEPFEAVFASELEARDENAATSFMDRVADAERNTSGEWLTASDELTVRRVAVEPDEPPDVRVTATGHETERPIERFERFPTELALVPRDSSDPAAIESVEYTVEGDFPDVVRERALERNSVLGNASTWTANHSDLDRRAVALAPNIADGIVVDAARYDRDLVFDSASGLEDDRFDDRIIDDRDDRVRRVNGTVDDENAVWMGEYPLTVVAEFDGRTCETTLSGSSQSIPLCTPVSDTAERAAELDWIEPTDGTEAYHVTLVVV